MELVGMSKADLAKNLNERGMIGTVEEYDG